MRIGGRHLGVHRREVVAQSLVEFLGLAGISAARLRRSPGSLAMSNSRNAPALVNADEFEIAQQNRGGRTDGVLVVVREMHDDLLARTFDHTLARMGEYRRQAAAFHTFRERFVHARQFGDGGKQVRADSPHMRARAWLDAGARMMSGTRRPPSDTVPLPPAKVDCDRASRGRS